MPSAHAAWSKQKTGSFAWLHAVFFVDERRGWAVGGKGALLATGDGGESWEVRRPPTEDAIKDLFFTDARTGWAVCERSIYMPMRKDESISYLLKTTDGGESWTRVDVTKGEDVDLKFAGVRFADSDHGWTFGESGALFATTDGGESWTRQRVPTRHLLLGATFLDAQTGWVVGAGATALSTTDGGATWRAGVVSAETSQPATNETATRAAQGESSLRINAVSFADARRGWAACAGGVVLSTTDGGRTWRAQSSGTESDLFDVKFFDAREGWAVGADGTAIHTADGGATWRSEPTGTPHALERLFFVGRTRGWAAGFGGTIIAFRS
ncbi:MAG TPA: YCF48-related protein [Pyrinomonadaceae bacterium]|nr:YCF48-related protein [Pyrinomonadaceae bacterium]